MQIYIFISRLSTKHMYGIVSLEMVVLIYVGLFF